MANFKKMEIAKAVSDNPKIQINKSFFSLSTSVIYKPTQSPVDAFQYYFTPEDGEKIEKAVKAMEYKPDGLEKLMGLERKPIGNVLVEACVSRDHQFVAYQLYRFYDFQYNAIGDIQFFEGEQAKTMAEWLV